MINTRKAELLAPAGSFDSLKAAVAAGADAIYMGGSRFGARAYAQNAAGEEMVEAIRYAHLHGCRLYMTVNTLFKEKELDELCDYMKPYYEAGLDGVIVQDLGALQVMKRAFPVMELHASTQMTVTSVYSAKMLKEMGCCRVVPARELSLEEISRIYKETGMDIETFVHGAMCISYSGRCLLSNYFTGRDANQGACTHPCRWKYAVMEESRPGEYLPVYENERGTYIFNSKDLCMIEHIPELIAAGIDSFKIEGRMKTALYVAVVARTYRKAIDDYLKDENLYRQNLPYYREQIAKCTYRQFTTGFFFGKPTHETQIYDSNTYVKEYTYLGIINGQNSQGMYGLEQRNKFSVGETIEVMKPDGRDLPVKVLRICDEEGSDMESCPHPKQKIYVDLGIELSDQDLLRRAEKSDN